MTIANEIGKNFTAILTEIIVIIIVLSMKVFASLILLKFRKYHLKNALFIDKISKILLENRSLNKEENKALLDSLLALISKDEQKEVSSIIASELLNYAPLSDTQNRIDKVWEWSELIRKELVLDIDYQSPYNTKKRHTIFPVSLSDYSSLRF